MLTHALGDPDMASFEREWEAFASAIVLPER